MKEIDTEKLLTTFRQWVEEQKPVLNSPTDDKFLLRFLRVNDFQLNLAKEHLVRFWKYRCENLNWFVENQNKSILQLISLFSLTFDRFQNRDFNENPLMRQIGESGYCFQLPKPTESGCLIFVMRVGHYNSSIMKFDDVTTYALAVADIINNQEAVQTNGLMIILDMSEVNLQHVPQFTNDFSRRYIDCWEKMFPAKMIQIHFYNYPNVFDPVYGLFRTLYFRGFDERIIIHMKEDNKLNENPLHQYINPELLPKEYGGKLGPIEEINQNFLIWVKQQDHITKELENYSIDLTKAQQLIDQLRSEVL